jgi:hypothetical protein
MNFPVFAIEDWYNGSRRHLSLSYVSPKRFAADWSAINVGKLWQHEAAPLWGSKNTATSGHLRLVKLREQPSSSTKAIIHQGSASRRRALWRLGIATAAA